TRVLPGGRGLFEKCVRSRQSRLVFVFVQISQENFGCAEKTAFVAQRWCRVALFASVGLTFRPRDAQLPRHGGGVSTLRTGQPRAHAWLKNPESAGGSKVSGTRRLLGR